MATLGQSSHPLPEIMLGHTFVVSLPQLPLIKWVNVSFSTSQMEGGQPEEGQNSAMSSGGTNSNHPHSLLSPFSSLICCCLLALLCNKDPTVFKYYRFLLLFQHCPEISEQKYHSSNLHKWWKSKLSPPFSFIFTHCSIIHIYSRFQITFKFYD